MQGLDLECGRRVVRNQNVKHVMLVLVPINLNNNHWIVACLDTEDCSITICDSLHGKHTNVENNLVSWFEAVFGKTSSPVAINQALIGKQTDADCGIAAMMFTAKEALNLADLPPM
eukprot:909540-Rhodomonas_salina.1